ncbi:MAG: hypothetical protein WC068_04810 [Caulobacter sp.]
MRRIVPFAVGFLIGSAGAYADLVLQTWTPFILRNESPQTLRLSVAASGRTVWQGDLPAGDVQAAVLSVDRDTGIRVSCAEPGKAPIVTEGEYLTPYAPTVVTLRWKSCAKLDMDNQGIP